MVVRKTGTSWPYDTHPLPSGQHRSLSLYTTRSLSTAVLEFIASARPPLPSREGGGGG